MSYIICDKNNNPYIAIMPQYTKVFETVGAAEAFMDELKLPADYTVRELETKKKVIKK